VLFCSVILIAAFGSRRYVLVITALLIPFPLMNILPFSASVGLNGVMLICVIVSLRVVLEVFILRKIVFFGPYSKEFLGLLSFLWLWTVIGALTLPAVFSGLQVVSGAGEYESLELNLSHAAQVIYITIYFLLVVWICGVSSPGEVAKEQAGGQLLGSNLLLISFVIAVFFSSYQLLSIASSLPYVSDFIYDMPRRPGAVFAVVTDLVPRINGSFAEASDAGRFYSAMIAAFLMACCCGLQHRFSVPTIIAFICVLLTFSSTAIVTVSLLLVICGLYLSRSFMTVKLKSISAVVVIITVLLGVSSFVLDIANLTLPELLSVIEHLTVGKIETNSFESRSSIDVIAIELAAESYFLGVGLGSHRSSSFVTLIISSLGLIGLLTFVFIGLRIFVLPKRFRTNENVILSAAIFGFVLAKSIAGPDLADNFLWFLVALWLRQICFTERNLNA
jgi:hypothetical protein